jgi:hypothetical protein
LLASPTCQRNGLGSTRCLVFPRAERFGRPPARIIAEFSGRQESGEPSRLEISASEPVAQWFSSSG